MENEWIWICVWKWTIPLTQNNRRRAWYTINKTNLNPLQPANLSLSLSLSLSLFLSRTYQTLYAYIYMIYLIVSLYLSMKLVWFYWITDQIGFPLIPGISSHIDRDNETGGKSYQARINSTNWHDWSEGEICHSKTYHYILHYIIITSSLHYYIERINSN